MWAERLRRRAAAAEEKRNRPRAVVALGGLALGGYAVAALARLGVSVLAQRSFDAFFFDRWSVVAYMAGQPGVHLAGAKAFAAAWAVGALFGAKWAFTEADNFNAPKTGPLAWTVIGAGSAYSCLKE